MIQGIIEEMGAQFKKGSFEEKKTFFFSMEDASFTVVVDADTCRVERGKTVEAPDCVCSTASEMLARIWYDGYQPGIMDFLGGAIKSNAPFMVQKFVKAFRK